MLPQQTSGYQECASAGMAATSAATISNAAWPLAARAQQSAMPVIGFLNAASSEEYTERSRGFHQGLKDEGFVEGENVAVEYRWADNQINRVSAMAAELVRARAPFPCYPLNPNYEMQSHRSIINTFITPLSSPKDWSALPRIAPVG